MIQIHPEHHGLFEPSRIALVDKDSKLMVRKEEIAAGGVFSIDPRTLDPTRDYAFKLQVQREGKWTDAVPYRRLWRDHSYVCKREAAADLALSATVIDPAHHGIAEACRVHVYDTLARRHVLEQAVPVGHVVALPNALFGGVVTCRYVFKTLVDGRWLSAGSYHQLTPSHLRGHPWVDFQVHRGALAYSRRAGVTIAPYRSHRRVGAQDVGGFLRVHQDGKPVPEALRITMGKQTHLFLPPEPAVETLAGTFVYGGIPNPSYGHFLTEGVARLWYAKEHPELPIVWNSRSTALTPMQSAILDLLGIRNPHLFVQRTTLFENVVFPVPGLGLGDYLLREHAEFLGVVPPQPVVAGKRTFLSRRSLAIERGSSDHDARIEELLREQGFGIYHPELHTLPEQLAELSSSELVVGIEGSALHSILFLRAPVATRFIAIGRHRFGSGTFEHTRQAKDLDYRTLDLRRGSASVAASDQVDIDMALLERLIVDTRGFSVRLELLEPHTATPDPAQSSYVEAVKGFRTGLTDLEVALAQAVAHLQRRDHAGALALLAPMFQSLRVASTRQAEADADADAATDDGGE